MAKKKKQEEASGGAPEWMATFADLMNLLLCFFVLLFSMSTVDDAKANQVADSLSSAFGIFKDSGTSIFIDGELVNLGTAQLNELDEMINNMGQSSEDTGEEIKGLIDAIVNGEAKQVGEVIDNINKELTGAMYDKISELSAEDNLDDFVTYSFDENGSRYVLLNIDGSVLFDSGSAEIKQKNIPIVSKIGDILKQFEGHRIEIIGHTDNVPIKTGRYPSNMELSSARAISVANYLIDAKGMDPSRMSWSGKAHYEPVESNADEEGRAKNRRIEVKIYNIYNSN